MSRTKKAAAAAEKETKPAEKKVTKVAEKAAEVKAAVETTVETTVEKAAVAPKKPEPTKVNFFVEYGGVQVSVDDVVANVKATYGKDAKEIAVYLKPNESKAYFVADGTEGEMDVFFC